MGIKEDFLKNYKGRKMVKYRYRYEPKERDEVCECTHLKRNHINNQYMCLVKNCKCKKFSKSSEHAYMKYLSRYIEIDWGSNRPKSRF